MISNILYINNLSAESGEILLSETVNSHQMNVSVLFPLELFATHVAGPVHVELHVGVELKIIHYWEPTLLSVLHLILLGKRLLTTLLRALEVGAVLPRQVSPESGQ